MTKPSPGGPLRDPDHLKNALCDAGFEIYKEEPDEIHLAERIRLHLMDSGVTVKPGEVATIRFTGRAQQSDFPNERLEALGTRVTQTIGTEAEDHGFTECAARTTDVKDPMDPTKTLDVWAEVTYEKNVESVDDLLEDLRWALQLNKYVPRP